MVSFRNIVARRNPARSTYEASPFQAATVSSTAGPVIEITLAFVEPAEIATSCCFRVRAVVVLRLESVRMSSLWFAWELPAARAVTERRGHQSQRASIARKATWLLSSVDARRAMRMRRRGGKLSWRLIVQASEGTAKNNKRDGRHSEEPSRTNTQYMWPPKLPDQ